MELGFMVAGLGIVFKFKFRVRVRVCFDPVKAGWVPIG